MTGARGILVALVIAGSGIAVAAPGDATPAENAFFESKVRPVLSTKCFACHAAGAQKVKGGLFLDSREGILKGGDSGPAIVAGDPEKSRLVQAVRWATKDLQMPPKIKLSDQAVSDLAAWVKMGAPWPGKGTVATKPAEYKATAEKAKKGHWAWQPVQKPAAGIDIDRLVQAKLEEAGLEPVGPADRASLLRRLSFDLVGLPPTPDELRDFQADTAADAVEKVVDRLLASPGFGERWGRHWLDVVRYAESTGSARNVAYPHAWRYRDYVIASFNDDKGYDRFVREQVAGDLLPASSPEEHDRMSVGTGFLALGVKDLNEKNNEQYLMDAIDDEIDVTGRAFLALTVSCARCHDHKFDPIPTADYYALAGIFRSTVELSGVKNRGKGGQKDYVAEDQLIVLGGKATASAPPPKEEPKKGKKGKKTKPDESQAAKGAEELLAMGVRDGSPTDQKILLHGEIEHQDRSVPRGVLTLFKAEPAVTVDPKSSGRRELAAWLTSPSNPLTARVYANRVWLHLFGEGIVPTTDNFGTSGEEPSHPELLDYLASHLVAQGWSVKKLIREIVLSKAYQRGGEAKPENIAKDPANRLLWRSSPRRLDAEAIRDSILAISGQLDPKPLVGSPVDELVGQIGGKKGPRDFEPGESRHRSVYLPIVRDEVPDFLHVFDFADPSSINGHRDTTTVAPQALLLMNSSFVVSQAKAWSEKLCSEKGDDPGRIDSAYFRALGRSPSSEERSRIEKYLAGTPGSRAQAWATVCQALLESAEFRYLGVPGPAGKETSRVR
jgi:cytochrome c553